MLRRTRVTFMSPLWQPQCSGQERGSLCSLTPRPMLSGSYGPASAFVSARSPPRPAPTRDVPPAPRAFPRPALASVPRPILACCPHACPCEWAVPPLHPWLPLSDIKAPHVHLSPLVPAKDRLVQRKCCLLAQDTCPTSRVPGQCPRHVFRQSSHSCALLPALLHAVPPHTLSHPVCQAAGREGPRPQASESSDSTYNRH